MQMFMPCIVSPEVYSYERNNGNALGARVCSLPFFSLFSSIGPFSALRAKQALSTIRSHGIKSHMLVSKYAMFDMSIF